MPNRHHALWVIFLACALAVVLPGRAHDGAHPVTQDSADNLRGQRWDFSLPTLDGSRFVVASALAGPVLVNFWGRDCGPCIAELPRLQAFAQTHPHWTVLLVSIDRTEQAREFVQRHNLTLPVLRPGLNVAALMRSAGNRSGGLPFSVTLRNGHLCSSRSGEFTVSDLTEIALGCQ